METTLVVLLSTQEDRRAAQKHAAGRFSEFLDEEYVSLGITFRTTWRDARDAVERKAPAETDVLEDNERRRILDELVSKLMKVHDSPGVACGFYNSRAIVSGGCGIWESAPAIAVMRLGCSGRRKVVP